MFLLSKSIVALVDPIAAVFIGSLVGLLLIRRHRRRTGIALLSIAIGSLYLLSTEPIAFLLTSSLERRYAAPRTLEEVGRVDAIVVLGGGANAARGYQPFPELGGASWRRLWRALEVWQALGRGVPIIYTGGSGDPFEPVSEEADLARLHAMAFGVPSEQFWPESQSRNTYENGRAVDRILQERLSQVGRPVIALVTSARHLPRAVGVFRRLNLSVIPIASDFDGGAPTIDPFSFIPSMGALASSTASLHEWVGLFGYKLLGRI